MDLEALLELYERTAPLLANAVADIYLTEGTWPRFRDAIGTVQPAPSTLDLGGIPIRFDPDMPEDIIELRRADGTVAKRIGLAH